MKIISASEIGEFYYCRLAWWMKKRGITPQKIKDIEKQIKITKNPEKKVELKEQIKTSKKIQKNLIDGIKRHEIIGTNIRQVSIKETQINYLKYLGYGIIALAIFLIIFSLVK